MDSEMVALIEAVQALTAAVKAQTAQQCTPSGADEIMRGVVALQDVMRQQVMAAAEAFSVATEQVSSLVLDPWKANPYQPALVKIR